VLGGVVGLFLVCGVLGSVGVFVLGRARRNITSNDVTTRDRPASAGADRESKDREAAETQTYTVKLKTHADVGMTVTIQNSRKESGSTRLFAADGKLLSELQPESREVVYALTILKRKTSEAPPEQFKRVYQKATETIGGKTRTFSFQGRTVVFERKDGTYQVGVAGTFPLDEKDLARFLEKANENTPSAAQQDRALTPPRAVAVGEPWRIDPRMLGDLPRDAELDLKASHAEARLVKVYARGTSRFGVIEINYKLAVKALGQDIKFDPPAIQESKRTIDTAIDGSSTARKESTTGKIKGKGILQQGGMKITMEVDLAMSSRQVRSQEKDDAGAREVPAVRLVGPGGDWAEFTSTEGRFSATFPGKPTVTSKKGKDDVTTTCQVIREGGSITYSVNYTDFARPNLLDPKALLRSVADSFPRGTRQKEVKLDGVDGVELVQTIEPRGGNPAVTLTFRVYFVQGRLYQVMVASAAGVKEKVQVSRFLDSFKLARQ
jgi:hypothetical protein